MASARGSAILPKVSQRGIVEFMFPEPSIVRVRALAVRILSALIFFAGAALAAVGAAPGDAPAPLLKAVVPTGSNVRVRVPVIEERMTTMQFKGKVPGARAKKGEMIEVNVGIENLPGPSYVSAKRWQSWGYEVPPNKIAVVPELILLGLQVAPKASKGFDVQIKMPAMRLEIIEPPGGVETVRGCDIFLSLKELTRNTDRTYLTRFYFQDKFFELTAPAGAVKRLGSGDEPPPEPATTADAGLVPFACPMRAGPLFAYCSVNGLTQYKTAAGAVEMVNAGVSSTNDWPTGVMMTIGAARGCGVELDQTTDEKGLGATFETRVLKGKIKELRLGAMTGPDFKSQKDIVIQDLTVWVDKSNSGHFMWLGPRFLDTYFKDQVMACGPDGQWQLYGRAKFDILEDIKLRPKKP